MRPITASLSLSRVDKSLLIEGKNGKYLTLAIFENRDGPDQYGNTHTIIQDVGKEARLAGKKGPIIGNARFPTEETQRKPAPPVKPPPRKPEPPKADPDLDAPEDDIPF